MKLNEIKDAISKGEHVYWVHEGYKVIKDKYEQYLIVCDNGYTTGLTWLDGVTMNGKEEDFFTQ